MFFLINSVFKVKLPRPMLCTTAFDNIEHNLHISLVFVDLKKGFDTVCYKKILNKLANYCTWRVAFKLLRSYLNYQKQFLNFNQIQSDLKEIKCAVFQGSYLGILSFLIYVSDLQNAVDCTPRLFADETCLIF